MTRCDYDAMFYRVFCITLLGIAFTFTVILTNVFVDIDGLLANKKDKLKETIIRDEFTTEATDTDDMTYGDSDDAYRTKRSIETQSFLFHIKNPKVKNILANRLSTLLEELEAEETADMKPAPKKIAEEPLKAVKKPVMAEGDKKDKILHQSMHNILLQGIERHMDLNDVYRRMYSLMTNFNAFHDRTDVPELKTNEIKKEGEEHKNPIEEKLLDEMLNCNELQDKMVQTTTQKPVKTHPNVVIKTVIDITSIGNDKLKENDTKPSIENIQGDIELVYNGKVIKFTHTNEDMLQPLPQNNLPVAHTPKKATIKTTTTKEDYDLIPKSYMNKFVEEYFKHFPHDTKNTNNEINQHFETKRLKRHVRIKYENNKSGEAKKTIKKNTEEDELYVEIETHFDSKGMKGEKKKKLIKNLIEKIQKAIHSDMTGKLTTKGKNSTNTKQHKSVQFRKRTQNPLAHNTSHVLINKYSLPPTNIVHRHLHPITKTIAREEAMLPAISAKSGEEWRKPNTGPGFLADTKAINSAEMSELNVDYSKILEINGIPQRLQQPLNTQLSEETIKTNSYYDMGKMKFVIKDIDGSGFSVGFNQYVDEPPDQESMRLFSGLENVIKSYHQKYDPALEPVSTTETYLDNEERPAEVPSIEHTIERRSINKKNDYHSNEYKIIFSKDFMPYNSYRDVYKGRKSNSKVSPSKDKLPLIVDENIFEKNLNPSEIFSLANLFERKRRSINVKKITNLNTRMKYNKFLNTNAMTTKKFFLNPKRSKRQINKIRIIATDLPHMSKHSDENVFVVSDENIFADRALVQEAKTADDHEKQEETEPYQNDEPGTYITKIFNGRSRHNPLMSKYPHIFMDEVSRSHEDYMPNNALLFNKLSGLEKTNTDVENSDDNIDIDQFMTTVRNSTESQKQLKEPEFISAVLPPVQKSNYKLTVKIVPKNQTGVNSGFKEIHTSINKSFNKNGLLYSSLVNVSEISKVVKMNRSRDDERYEKDFTTKDETFLTRKIHDQQEKMQFLLKQHAKHINEQLNRLNEEKINLESMLNGDTNTTLFNKLSINHFKLVKGKDEVGAKSAETPKVVHTTTVTYKPREETPPSTTTPAPARPIQSFSENLRKNAIINTIERNGNLTDQILKKIDRNTEILQMFLKKLTERIEAPPPSTPKPEVIKDENPYPPDWRNQGIPFTQNMIIRKNDSHISIPFTYAYQPPTSLPIKSKTQVASVVYQGHIRNAVHQKENLIQKIPEAHNQSRFFIDELENEYKIVQMGGFKKNPDYNMAIKNNTVS